MAPPPKIMKGILIEKTGGTEVLQYKTDLPIPVPKAGELLVKNEYIGINYIDTFVLNVYLYQLSVPPHRSLSKTNPLVSHGEINHGADTSAPASTKPLYL